MTSEQVEKARQSKAMMVAAMMVPWLITVVLTLGLVYHLDQAIKKADHDWCDLLTSLVQPEPGTPPPSTKRAIDIANKINVIRKRKGCRQNAIALSGVTSVIQRQNLLLNGE